MSLLIVELSVKMIHLGKLSVEKAENAKCFLAIDA